MTELSSESDTSSLTHAEIYCDEFLGTAVFYRDREMFLEAAGQLVECNSSTARQSHGFPFHRRQDSGVSKYITSPIPTSFQGKDKPATGHKVHEVKADLLR